MAVEFYSVSTPSDGLQVRYVGRVEGRVPVDGRIEFLTSLIEEDYHIEEADNYDTFEDYLVARHNGISFFAQKVPTE